MATVALVGTLDTKGADFAYLAERLRAHGADVVLVDTGTSPPHGAVPDVPQDEVAQAAGTTVTALRDTDRGVAVTAMGRGAAVVVARLVEQGRVDAVLGAGGSGGSSIAAAVMAAARSACPSCSVSTMASGDIRRTSARRTSR